MKLLYVSCFLYRYISSIPDWSHPLSDTKVPRSWSENPQLAEWVGLQRICSSDYICNGKRKHLTSAERIAKLKSIGFDFYVYHTNRTAKIDAYLKSNPSKKHPALDVASKEDSATESTGEEVENRDLDVTSTGEAIKSNLPGERIVLIANLLFVSCVTLYLHIQCFIHRCSYIIYADRCMRYRSIMELCQDSKGREEQKSCLHWYYTLRNSTL